jgi:SAM-dependent methyltransferase
VGFNRAPRDYQILACPGCGRHDWLTKDGDVLGCASCQGKLGVEDNIIDCLSANRDLSPVAVGWNNFYKASAEPYSAEADWWRISCWKKHLFGRLGGWSQKLVVDFGCGAAVRVAVLAPIQLHRYRYLGIDCSMDALKRAACVLPGGLFIRADLDSVTLQPEMADIVLCLGILMYFKDYSKPLNILLDVLKPGGWMLIHEQICRKTWRAWTRFLFRPQREVYPEAHTVKFRELNQGLTERGVIFHTHLAGSPWRKVFMELLDGTPLEPLRPLAAWADSFWCATIGRLLPALGASEIQIVFRKT